MSPQQNSKRRGRQHVRPANQHVAPGSKDDGVGVTTEPVAKDSLQDIEGKEPKTPSRSEVLAKDKGSTRGRHGARESLGGDHEEGAVLSGETTNVASPSADNLKETTSSFPFHLDDKEIWHAICALASDQLGDTRLLADTVHRKLMEVKDYQFLLEAVRCQTLREPKIRDTCIRLYLLVKRYSSLEPGSNVEEQKAYFERLSEEYFNNGNDEIDQVAVQLQRMAKRQISGDEGDERATSISQTSFLFPQAQSPRKKNSKVSWRQSFGEATQFRPPYQVPKAELEVGYHVKESKWFTVGRVFTMLWHDNATGAKRHAMDTGFMSPGPYGQKIYSQIRRFAVVKQCHGFSWAIPIHTYHEKGISRDSFNDEDRQAHAIIYMKGTEPTPLPDEPIMTKNPIMVDKTTEDKKLHPASRIRFDKVFTIEHNVIVRNVGKISESSMPYFRRYWQEQVGEPPKAEATVERT